MRALRKVGARLQPSEKMCRGRQAARRLMASMAEASPDGWQGGQTDLSRDSQEFMVGQG